jgi:hypothetical protein
VLAPSNRLFERGAILRAWGIWEFFCEAGGRRNMNRIEIEKKRIETGREKQIKSRVGKMNQISQDGNDDDDDDDDDYFCAGFRHNSALAPAS